MIIHPNDKDGNAKSTDFQFDHDVTIIGGGIVGLACAVGLIQKGITNIAVYERAKSIEPVGAALALYPNGYNALREISPTILSKIRKSCVPNHYDVVKDLAGDVIRETKPSDMRKIGGFMPDYAVRYLLHQYLIDETPKESIHLGCSFDSVSVDKVTGLARVQIVKRGTGKREVKTCRVLIGADGIRSAVRTKLFGNRMMIYHGRMIYRGVMEKGILDEGTCPPRGVCQTYLGKEKGKMFTFREAAKDLLTIQASVALDVPSFSPDKYAKKEKLRSLFKEFPKDVNHILDKLPDSAIHEDGIYSINPEEVWSSGPVVIIGDASHAMAPALEQGANTGLEDACELVHDIAAVLIGTEDLTIKNKCDKIPSTIPDALKMFWERRIDRVKEIYLWSDKKNRQDNKSNVVKVRSVCDLDGEFLRRLHHWKPSYAPANIFVRFRGIMQRAFVPTTA